MSYIAVRLATAMFDFAKSIVQFGASFLETTR
jgi:hypothetical protein